MTTYRDAGRLAEKAPSDRNRHVDFLRAASIMVVVLGHWLMAAPQVHSDAFHVDPPTWQPVAAAAMACIGLGLLAVDGVADADGLNGFALALPLLPIVVGGVGLARLREGAIS